MALTFPAALCFQNAADTATITASTSLTQTPPSLLQDQHIGRKWRAQTDTAALTIALAASTTIDTIGLFGVLARSSAGVDITSLAVTRIRVSLTDTSAVDGALYDSGSSGGRVSSYYGNLVALLSAPVNGRYIRIDLSCTGAAYLEAGFLMVGLKNQVGINFAIGAQDTPVDPSIKTKSRSGATWVDPRNLYRLWEFNFEFLSSTERFSWVEDLDHLCGSSRNVMLTRDCAASNLGRASICGLIVEGAPIISRDGYMSDGLPAYSKSYKIEQRL